MTTYLYASHSWLFLIEHVNHDQLSNQLDMILKLIDHEYFLLEVILL